MNSSKVTLKNGEVTIMDCGKLQIHVYNTKDAIDDQVIILEKPHMIGKGGKAVVIELPCFKNSIEEILAEEGFEEGSMEMRMETARRMIARGCLKEDIQEMLELSADEIRRIAKEMKKK